ncbi:MAG TPA: hypothetical protein VEH77_11710 [Roseiarcus sp.]|nr:hypothetical protein [Roseiarcus sp.]
MMLARLGVIGLACAALAAEAWADEAATPAHRHAKATVSKADGLAGVKFFDPYAPPEGAGQAKTGDFPAADRAPPAEPKSDLSLTYKWRASNAPNDPYDHVRHLTPDGPGDAFMGGLKLGF